MSDEPRIEVRPRRRRTAPASARRSGDVRLRSLRRRDLRRVTAIDREVYGRPWSKNVFATELGKAGRNYVAATAPVQAPLPWPRRIVGYAGSMLVDDEVHVTTVVVRPEQRRRGVGTRLVARLLRDARDGGATAATLEVRASNHPAQTLYRRFGFAPVGYRRGYYDDTGEDALIMWLHDLDTWVSPTPRSRAVGSLTGDPLEAPSRRRRKERPSRPGAVSSRPERGEEARSPGGDLRTGAGGTTARPSIPHERSR